MNTPSQIKVVKVPTKKISAEQWHRQIANFLAAAENRTMLHMVGMADWEHYDLVISMRRLALRVGTSIRTVQRAMRGLESKGFVLVNRRYTAPKSGRRWEVASRYVLQVHVTTPGVMADTTPGVTEVTPLGSSSESSSSDLKSSVTSTDLSVVAILPKQISSQKTEETKTFLKSSAEYLKNNESSGGCGELDAAPTEEELAYQRLVQGFHILRDYQRNTMSKKAIIAFWCALQRNFPPYRKPAKRLRGAGYLFKIFERLPHPEAAELLLLVHAVYEPLAPLLQGLTPEHIDWQLDLLMEAKPKLVLCDDLPWHAAFAEAAATYKAHAAYKATEG